MAVMESVDTKTETELTRAKVRHNHLLSPSGQKLNKTELTSTKVRHNHLLSPSCQKLNID